MKIFIKQEFINDPYNNNIKPSIKTKVILKQEFINEFVSR